MKLNKNKIKILVYITMHSFLFTLCLPAVSIKAATNWTSDVIKFGSTIAVGDTITSKTFSITYYDVYGTYIDKTTGTNNKVVEEYYDPKTGSNYKQYLVTALNAVNDDLKISLTGISPDLPDLQHTLTDIVIKKAPDKTTYIEGEVFNKNGMVVSAYYSDNRWRDITNYTISPSGALTLGTKYITITYKENDKTYTANQNITVTAKESDTDSYCISASAAAGGSISDAGDTWLKRGENKTYNITPGNGYRINYVEVNGSNIGAVSSYTFSDIQSNNSITAYFLSGTADTQRNIAKKNLTIVGSFAQASGAGSYAPGTKVTVDAGFVPGFAFAGWIASDGIIYPMPSMSYTMPGYDVLLYANWVQSGSPNAFGQITTTNLKGQQLTNWTDITNKLATFNTNDLNQPGAPVMRVTANGVNCYIDAAPIAMLNTRKGIALDIAYGPDASFTFYSDMDNAQFTGSDLTYACTASTSLFFHEKNLVFAQPGPINTGICLNLLLPDAQPGQTAYVYLTNDKGAEIMYLPAIVDINKKISIPLSAKVNLNIKY